MFNEEQKERFLTFLERGIKAAEKWIDCYCEHQTHIQRRMAENSKKEREIAETLKKRKMEAEKAISW